MERVPSVNEMMAVANFKNAESVAVDLRNRLRKVDAGERRQILAILVAQVLDIQATECKQPGAEASYEPYLDDLTEDVHMLFAETSDSDELHELRASL